MKGLFDLSKSYYEENKYYEIFSNAEDKPNHILNFLLKKVKNKNVLDIGCGTGKYSVEIIKHAKSLIGIDKSKNQLEIAKSKTTNKSCFVCADAANLPFKNNTFDVIVSCWCVGTILDKKTQQKVINEAKRVLNKDGEIYFVENDIGEEFEQIRDRYPNIEKTKAYNDFLLLNGFTEIKKINTYFEFETIEDARQTFDRIWGSKTSEKITSKIIKHKVVIFKYFKK